MNKEQFLNKEVINSDGQKGIVTSFDGTFVSVKYENIEKSYRFDLAFKNKFLSFVDDALNSIIEEELLKKYKKEAEHEKELQKVHDDVLEKINRVNKLHDELEKKNDIMLGLFGRDFKYPPYVKFMKKYKLFVKTKWRFGKIYWYDVSMFDYWF